MDVEISDPDDVCPQGDTTETYDEETKICQNSAWADAMSKVLHSCPKSSKQLILTKAKHDTAIRKKKVERSQIEIVGSEGQVLEANNGNIDSDALCESSKVQRRKEMIEQQVKRKAWESMCRSKANGVNKEKERRLMKVATRSVVQLFNAVQKHQRGKDEKVSITSKKGSLKKQKAIKGNFLDILQSTVVKSSDATAQKTSPKKETWDVLKDDFMVGTTLKDWDKSSDEDI